MLTPAQIRGHRFITAVRGSYKADDVDVFFEDVAVSYEQAFRENAELIKKISMLAQMIEEYRDEEDNIKSTLLTAQRVADEMTNDAKEKSAQMLQSATEKLEYAESSSKVKAQIIIDEANKAARGKIIEADDKAKQTIDNAVKKAEEVLEESKRESVEQLIKIKDDLQKEKICLEILEKETSSFKEELKEKYRQHLDFIEAIPAAVAETIRPSVGSDGFVQESVEPVTQMSADLESNVLQDDTITEDGASDNSFEEDVADSNSEPETEESEDSLLDVPEDVAESSEPEGEQKDIDGAIEEIEDFLFKNEDAEVVDSSETETVMVADVSDDESREEYASLQETKEIEESEESEEIETQVEPEVVEDDEIADDSEESGLPGLFSLRQMAMAQQQELNNIDANADPDSTVDDLENISSDKTGVQTNNEDVQVVDLEEDEEESDDDGFKVYLDNLDADDGTLSGDLDDESSDKKSLFETVDYDDDDENEDDTDGDKQPRFKGFFKK